MAIDEFSEEKIAFKLQSSPLMEKEIILYTAFQFRETSYSTDVFFIWTVKESKKKKKVNFQNLASHWYFLHGLMTNSKSDIRGFDFTDLEPLLPQSCSYVELNFWSSVNALFFHPHWIHTVSQ